MKMLEEVQMQIKSYKRIGDENGGVHAEDAAGRGVYEDGDDDGKKNDDKNQHADDDNDDADEEECEGHKACAIYMACAVYIGCTAYAR